MRQLALLAFFLFSLTLTAQEIVTIERNKTTEQLFDENNPLSFLSILQQNSRCLSYYSFEGIDSSTYNRLTELEKESTFKFLGPQSYNPVLDEYGDPLIVQSKYGDYLEYVYPDRDSTFIDLYNIDKIEFTLHEGKTEPMKRLDKLHLWKQYESGMKRVLTIDAAAFMSFDGLSVAEQLSENQTNTLTGPSENPTLWSIMRDSSIQQMKGFQGQLINGVFEERMTHAGNNLQSYFPYLWSLNYNPCPTSSYYKNEDPDYGSYFDFDRIYPVSLDLASSVSNYQKDAESLKEKFDSVHYLLTQNMVPLTDEYGDPLTKMIEHGSYEYIYPEPTEEYFFLDYDPVIIITKQVICDSAMNCQITPYELLFCLKNGCTLSTLFLPKVP